MTTQSIHDTNVSKIQDEFKSLIKELDDNYDNNTNKSIPQLMEQYESRFSYIKKTSISLYTKIISDYYKIRGKKNEEESFVKNLNMMLEYILKIQNKEMSEYDASGVIGTHLSDIYVQPHLQ